ncbi:MAG TPA: hypothetical protein PLN04_06595 [Moraxellaceae bacterium]|jgi:hypothetical protein|nr:hypothetical protein [Moraxellaceae bacterium]
MMKRILVLPALMVSILALSGCDAGSSNLDDPIQGPASSCTGDKCTPGIFSPVVKDLEYKCANITALTSANGFFSCPVEETVSFLISHPESDFTIKLGNFVMKKPYANAVDNRFFVTPRNLAGSETSTLIGNREQNIIALLQALNSLTGVTPGLPSYRISLPSADKKAFLNALGRSLDTADFDSTPADFALLVNGALLAVGKPILASEADTKALLATAVNATVAGIYYSFAPLSNDGINQLLLLTTQTGLTDTPGFIGQSAGVTLLGHTALAVDRSGRLFGFGEYVKGVNLRSAPREYLDFRVVASNALTVAPSGNALLWPYNGNLKGLSFALENTNIVTLSQGVVERGAMAATTGQYEEQYKLGLATASVGKLGAWTASGTIPSGRFNLYRSGFIFPVLTPEVWDGVSFPLHLTAKIYKSSTAAGEENCTSVACLLKEVPLTILADGNVVTDSNVDCAAVNPVTLSDGSVTEAPVGVVNRAIDAVDSASPFLDVSLLFPISTFKNAPTDKRRHIQVGTWSSAFIQLTNTFEIKVDGVNNSATWYDFFVEYTDSDSTEIAGKIVFSPRCP